MRALDVQLLACRALLPAEWTFEVKNLSKKCLQELLRCKYTKLEVHEVEVEWWEGENWTVCSTISEMANFFKECGIFTAQQAYNMNVLQELLGPLVSNSSRMPKEIIEYFLPAISPVDLVLTVNTNELKEIFDFQGSSEFKILISFLKKALELEDDKNVQKS